MKKIFGLMLIAMVAVGFVTAPVFADVNKGQKIFIKKMKKSCGFTGGEMSKKNTQAEWKTLYEAGSLNDEMIKECPDAKPLKDSYLPHVYEFLYNYASDSGNVPAC